MTVQSIRDPKAVAPAAGEAERHVLALSTKPNRIWLRCKLLGLLLDDLIHIWRALTLPVASWV